MPSQTAASPPIGTGRAPRLPPLTAALVLVLLGTLPAAASQAEGQADPAPEEGARQQRLEVGELPSEARVLQLEELEGVPITVDFVDTDIRDVARFFSQLSGLNIILDPGITGPVTMRLFEVPWDTAFEAILRSHRLGYQVRNNIVRVASLETLASEAQERAQLAEQEALAAPLRTITVPLSYARADELTPIVTAQLSQRGEVMVDTRTNSLIIKDTDDNIGDIDELVTELDVPSPQVMIESRIVETTKEFTRELGIQWGFNAIADAAHGNTTGLVFPNDFQVTGNTVSSGLGGFPFAVNLPAGDATSGVSLSLGNILDSFRLDMALSAMEEEGRGKIISRPKVTAQDNIEASIESGQRIPVQTLVDNTVSITFINANLQLRVTPQITAERTIMLDILVDKSEPDFGNQVLGIPTIFTRRAETKLLVRDGGTTVIGGIFQMSSIDAEQRVPFFHRIPLIGSLFKSKRNQQTNNELLIFITPRILEQ